MYTYFGYPLFLYMYTLYRTKHVNKGAAMPYVSVVIAVFNEEKYIRRRIENILEQDYPAEKIEIVVVSDGSYDGTVQIVKAMQKTAGNISLHVVARKSGKAAVLNLGVAGAKGEIIVFADARQVFHNNSIRELVANFSDSHVGAVSGELFMRYMSGNAPGESVGLYWKYEKWLRKKESQVDSVIGSTGAIYAIRRELFEPVPEGTILDDVYIPMKIALKGFRVVFDEEAKAYDDLEVDHSMEFGRKVRTLTGNFQILSLLPELCSPGKNRLFFNYMSHKVLRLFIPYFMIGLFVMNFFLLEGIYRFTLALQVMFYVTAFAGYMLSRQNWKSRLPVLSYTFVLLNFAAVLGLLNFLRKNDDVWVGKNL